MPAPRMHSGELDIDVPLVRRLVSSQFPAWTKLPIEPVASAGTDNAIYRLGDEMAARLPRLERVVPTLTKERRWLPWLAPQLPLEIPVPLAAGHAGEGYPWSWSVYSWLQGEAMDAGPGGDLRPAALRLAQFLDALQGLDASGGPPPGEHNFARGVPLMERDAETRAAIGTLAGLLDAPAATRAWAAALEAPPWERPPVWIHGDLLPGNLLAVAGTLTAVIDFGGLAVGDPACDLMVAWTLFSAESRTAFRDRLEVDDASWARGRGWALSWALVFIPYYLNSNPRGVALARRTIDAVLADRG